MLNKDQRSQLLKARRSIKFAKALISEVREEVPEYSLALDEGVRSAEKVMGWLNELVEDVHEINKKSCVACGRDLASDEEALGVCGRC